ncbi:RHS repeat-associated core domain-containing protein, partial [Achromobacter sp. NFACC18-2]|uniref:RHS repeat-associated core domain-containing protein n=1 Tax=Achromobacter sp. NFACC18-2 TaxID=1564112 RepID=UPI0008D6F154
HNGQRSRFEWDLFNRLTGYSNDRLHVSYQYDALGRRLLKQSEAHWRERPGMTPAQIREDQARANRAMGCSTTLYGWDGDTLAWEGRDDQTTHYLYEPGSFVPLAQAISRKPILLHQQPAYAGAYDIDRDPLWTTSPDPDPVDAMAWYHCDHLGTPQELTDAQGEIVWSAHYQAWGEAKEAITDAARAAGIRNPIRFQGQYLDRETGLHYNRHRYYDPQIGRFITKDPIGFAGGSNVYQYADNPVGWVDPLGLAATTPPDISALDLTDKTRSEIRQLADLKGLIPSKSDKEGLPIKWSCPCTGMQRLRLDRGHIDAKTGLPYNDPKAAVDHVHGYDSTGKGKIVSPGDGNPHFPTLGE